MKPLPVLFGAALVAAVSAAITSVALTESRSNFSAESSAELVAEAASRLDALTTRLSALEQRFANLSSVERVAAAEHAIDDATIERWVERVLEKRRAIEGATPAVDETDFAELLEDLTNPDVASAEKRGIWQRLRESDQIDAMVEEFERRADAAPFDSMAHTERGWAYFQKMLSTGGGPEAGKWGAKGAEALVRALELDETNWDARFSLALHFFHAEMRGDAMRHLEILIDPQKNRVAIPKHAQAYVLLGNIYMDRGQRENALKVWSDGLERFPADVGLRDRLAAFP